MVMAFWLLKSEPASWSWDDQVVKGVETWTGVRNYQAANNMKAMALGDQAFFYHSVTGKCIVGIVEVAGLYHDDPTDPSGRFGAVDVKTLTALPRPVSLAEIKADPRLAHLALIRQSRLSVMPIDAQSWSILCGLGGL